MAPEVLKRGHFTISSDIWAYGIFLVELFNDGKLPYKGGIFGTTVVTTHGLFKISIMRK